MASSRPARTHRFPLKKTGELSVVREEGGSSCDFELTCYPSSSVEGLLKPSESLKGTFRGSGDPTFPESLFKRGRLSKPGGDGRSARDAARAVAKRETNRKVIGETGTGGPDGMIGGVMGDVNNRVKQGVSTDRGRGQEPVQTRRPGELRGRFRGVDVEVSVSVVFHVDHPKVGLKTFPNVQKTTRGEGSASTGGVRGPFDEVEITANKGRDRGV